MGFLTVLQDSALRRRIFRLAWPTMTETALQTLVQYVDTAQVGRLGAEASAAVGLTATTTWLVNAPLWALGAGVLTCISQALGAEDRERAERAAGQSLLLTLVVGAVMTVLTLSISPFLPVWLGADAAIRADAGRYFFIICTPMLFRASAIIFAAALRAAGDAKTPMWIDLVMNTVNIVLNFLLINKPQTLKLGTAELAVWGAGLGVTGAAIATAASYVVGGVWMFAAAERSPQLGGLKPIPDRETLRRCLGVSTPIAADRIVSMLGQVVFTAMVAKLGTIAVAAHAIAITAEQVFYIPGYGMQTAASALTGRYYGARDERNMMDHSMAVILIAVALMSALSLFLFLFPAFFMSIFTPDPAVIALGARVLRLVSVSEPFFAALIILEGVFNGAGDVRMPLLFSILSMWGVRIFCTRLCVTRLRLGLTAVWGCMVADNLTRFALMAHRYRGEHWKRGISIQNTD